MGENIEASKLETDAIGKLQCLMLNNPYEFIEGIVRLAAQEAFDARDRGRYDVRPKDTSMTIKVKSWMSLIKHERSLRGAE